MPKSTIKYWNPLSLNNQDQWQSIAGLEHIAEELTLSIDPKTGEYTRLTRFYPGADTTTWGAKSHPYPEEILIVSGRLFDRAFNMWLETGHYASRSPGELHGPFSTDIGCVVLEISFPDRVSSDSEKSLWWRWADVKPRCHCIQFTDILVVRS